MAHHSFQTLAHKPARHSHSFSSFFPLGTSYFPKDFLCMDFREKRRKKLLFELSNATDSSKEEISALRFQREKDSKRVTGHSSYCSSTGVVPDGCSTFTLKEPPVRSHETRIIPDGVGTSPEA